MTRLGSASDTITRRTRPASSGPDHVGVTVLAVVVECAAPADIGNLVLYLPL